MISNQILSVAAFMLLISGCNLKSSNGQGKGMPVMPSPQLQIYDDRDHDLIADGLDANPDVALVPQWEITSMKSLTVDLPDMTVNVKNPIMKTSWGVKEEALRSWLFSDEGIGEEFLLQELMPRMVFPIQSYPKLHAALAATYLKNESETDVDVKQSTCLELNYEMELRGHRHDKFILYTQRWAFLGFKNELVSNIKLENMNFPLGPGQESTINRRVNCQEGNWNFQGLANILEVKPQGMVLLRANHQMPMEDYYSHLFEKNVTVIIVTGQGQQYFSFAPGKTFAKMMQLLDAGFEWDERHEQIRLLLNRRQELPEWKAITISDPLSLDRGRWDIISRRDLNFNSPLIAGEQIILNFSTFGEYLASVNPVIFKQNSPERAELSGLNLTRGQKILLKLKLQVERPKFSLQPNVSFRALIDQEIPRENRGVIRRTMEGDCGVDMLHFESYQTSFVSLLEARELQLNLHEIDPLKIEWHLHPVNEAQGEYVLALEFKEGGNLNLVWNKLKETLPTNLGMQGFANCHIRHRGENFRWANGADPGPWPNIKAERFLFEVDNILK